ncbi:MAG: hypothetical protein IJT23_08260 [Clostridia bacterium]|nr:hypothetical protein [Clostridia bacterium]
MKKLLLCMVFALCAAASANAYAADATYDKDTGIVNIPDETRNVKTVIITDEDPTQKTIEDKNIYYMDQALQGSPLSAATGFAIKEDPPAGTYYMTLRYSDDTTDNKEFTVIKEIMPGDLPMNPIGTSIFVTTDAVDSSNYSSIKVGFTKDGTTTYLGCNLDELGWSALKLGDTNGAFVGVQLNGADGYDSVSMWLSPDILEDIGGNSNE